MEIQTMGKVVVAARIESLEDLYDVEKGRLSADQVRCVQVDDALVDTGATMVSLPRGLIERLGLRRSRTRTAQTAAGVFSFGIHEPVRLTIQDRDCVVEVAELPDGCPVLIGQIPLEALDFVVDPIGQRLIGNPAHGGKHMFDMF
jgi:predicted aspartyl protease